MCAAHWPEFVSHRPRSAVHMRPAGRRGTRPSRARKAAAPPGKLVWRAAKELRPPPHKAAGEQRRLIIASRARRDTRRRRQRAAYANADRRRGGAAKCAASQCSRSAHQMPISGGDGEFGRRTNSICARLLCAQVCLVCVCVLTAAVRLLLLLLASDGRAAGRQTASPPD